MKPIINIHKNIRHFIYKFFIDHSIPPSVSDVSTHFNISEDTAILAFHSLADSHQIVLKPNTNEIWMAHPFSAFPTDLIATVSNKKYWANCMWDLLGIAAILNQKTVANINCGCGECIEKLTFNISPEESIDNNWIIHFLVPAKDFWAEIGYT